MNMSRSIQLRGRVVAGGAEPLVCAPLVARDLDSLRAEAATVVAKQPDLLEWRVDFFEALGDVDRIAGAARELRRIARDIPIIYTRRSIREGGQPITASEDTVSRGIETVCADGSVDFVDCELGSAPEHFQRALRAAKACGALLIGSFHDFQRTPSLSDMAEKFATAERLGADVAKVAVMPGDVGDVLALLQATLDASRRHAMPLITMSMGPYGALTRLFGWMFGSTVSFAVGSRASAPGQVPIDDVRSVLEVLRRSLSAR
ncbi:MAG: type I 3-dehydroquinate dehydratase [Burkholderiales bacterium]|nr:type I 3-dehydroquinate dehydratase [Burkholderiales bacterium]